jgi:hypothetical protein
LVRFEVLRVEKSVTIIVEVIHFRVKTDKYIVNNDCDISFPHENKNKIIVYKFLCLSALNGNNGEATNGDDLDEHAERARRAREARNHLNQRPINGARNEDPGRRLPGGAAGRGGAGRGGAARAPQPVPPPRIRAVVPWAPHWDEPVVDERLNAGVPYQQWFQWLSLSAANPHDGRWLWGYPVKLHELLADSLWLRYQYLKLRLHHNPQWWPLNLTRAVRLNLFRAAIVNELGGHINAGVCDQISCTRVSHANEYRALVAEIVQADHVPGAVHELWGEPAVDAPAAHVGDPEAVAVAELVDEPDNNPPQVDAPLEHVELPIEADVVEQVIIDNAELVPPEPGEDGFIGPLIPHLDLIAMQVVNNDPDLVEGQEGFIGPLRNLPQFGPVAPAVVLPPSFVGPLLNGQARPVMVAGVNGGPPQPWGPFDGPNVDPNGVAMRIEQAAEDDDDNYNIMYEQPGTVYWNLNSDDPADGMSHGIYVPYFVEFQRPSNVRGAMIFCAGAAVAIYCPHLLPVVLHGACSALGYGAMGAIAASTSVADISLYRNVPQMAVSQDGVNSIHNYTEISRLSPYFSMVVVAARLSSCNLRPIIHLQDDFTHHWLRRNRYTHFINRRISTRLFNAIYRRYSGGLTTVDQLRNIKNYAQNHIECRNLGIEVINATCQVVHQTLDFELDRELHGTPVEPTRPVHRMWMS